MKLSQKNFSVESMIFRCPMYFKKAHLSGELASKPGRLETDNNDPNDHCISNLLRKLVNES